MSGPAPAVEALSGWRRPLIGAPLLDALSGKLGIKVAANAATGLELVRD
jgi:hypothetical protein